MKILFLNEIRKRGYWFESKADLVHFFRNKFRSLNKKSEINHYRVWCCHIQVPPETVDVFNFKGIETTKWLR